MAEQKIHIIMPVKDSIETTEKAISAIVASGYTVRVYDDFSSAETAARLDAMHKEMGIEVIHLSEQIDSPSPNYRWVLQDAQRRALKDQASLLIIESDVIVGKDTIKRMTQAVEYEVGMVGAVTHDVEGQVNFPYLYAKNMTEDGECKKHLSFCCTLLTNRLLQAYDFEQLNPKKDWHDVDISHMSRKLGFVNVLQVTNPVLHLPHSSRPWKQLKYTNPTSYYLAKMAIVFDWI